MRLSHDEYYLKILDLVAQRSTCARRAVGAIIVDEKHRVLSTGYNGVPSGITHCTDSPCAGAQDEKGDTRWCMAVHAEINAMLQCTQLFRAYKMYVSCSPCFECAKAIVNAGIKIVVCKEVYAVARGPLGTDVLSDAGVQLEVVKFEGV
jgi:dCMP deaminase